MKDLLIAIAWPALLLALAMGGAATCSCAKCDELTDVSNRPTKWKLISGCYVKVEGRWIPRDSWRGEQDGVVIK